jgi:hypothetical protein
MDGSGEPVKTGFVGRTQTASGKGDGGAVWHFRHDGINLLEVTNSAGSVTKLTHGYTIIGGIGSVVEVDVDGTRYFLEIDIRGTVCKITDSAGDVVWTGLCDAWGKGLSEVGTNPTIFWYQGQAWWKLTVNGRLFYVSPTRIFDTTDGRFAERDPLYSTISESSYGWNTPTFTTDPDGQCAWSTPTDEDIKAGRFHSHYDCCEGEGGYVVAVLHKPACGLSERRD